MSETVAQDQPAAPAVSTRKVRMPGRQAVVQAETPPDQAAATDADLPNSIDIDPKTISGPVLTRQGWVCPDETGRHAPGPR